MAELNFNSANVEPQESFDTFPIGWYGQLIEKAELKPTKSGDGSYISLQLRNQGGVHDNRVVFDMITYTNPNSVAVDIGHRKLSALCRAVNIGNLTNTSMLENKVVASKIGIQKGTEDYPDDKNVVKEYAALAASQDKIQKTDQTNIALKAKSGSSNTGKVTTVNDPSKTSVNEAPAKDPVDSGTGSSPAPWDA